MTRSRNRGDADHDHYGRVGPAPVEGLPLFGGNSEKPAAPRTPDVVPPRYNPPPPSWDALKADNKSASPITDEIRRQARERARAPESLPAPSAPNSQTSKQAADLLTPSNYRQTLLGRVFEYITMQGERGATRAEIAEALGLQRRVSSVTARVNELYRRGRIGSNCVEGCTSLCEHDVVTRLNPDTGMRNEVMVHEQYVRRWKPEQVRR